MAANPSVNTNPCNRRYAQLARPVISNVPKSPLCVIKRKQLAITAKDGFGRGGDGRDARPELSLRVVNKSSRIPTISKRQHTRYRSLMRMFHCLVRSCASAPACSTVDQVNSWGRRLASTASPHNTDMMRDPCAASPLVKNCAAAPPALRSGSSAWMRR